MRLEREEFSNHSLCKGTGVDVHPTGSQIGTGLLNYISANIGNSPSKATDLSDFLYCTAEMN